MTLDAADTTAPEDRETLRCPPGTPCMSIFCGDVSLPNSTRCSRHSFALTVSETSARLEDSEGSTP